MTPPLTSLLFVGSGAFWATTLALIGAMIAKFKNSYDALLLIFITTVAATSYLALAVDLGNVTNEAAIVQTARYVDWFVTTPLLLYTLLTMILPAMPSNVLMLAVIVIDMYMIVMGLLAAIEPGSYKWIWFGLSGLALVVIAALLYGPIYRYARKTKAFALYKLLSIYLGVLWFLYPVVWILSDSGVGVISFLTENILYFILDFLAKAVFSILVLTALVKLQPKKLNV